jgi:hypothetical protein
MKALKFGEERVLRKKEAGRKTVRILSQFIGAAKPFAS